MYKIVKRIILALICLFLVFSLFKQRKYYVFTCKNDIQTTSWKNEFNSTQINQLSKKDSIMRISVGNIMFVQTQYLGFRIFAKQYFKQVRISHIEILYDNKHKILKKKNVYEPDDSNKNTVFFKDYEVDGIIYTGVEKLIFATFNTKDSCKVNFYDMFKWRHGKLNDKFPVKIICHYSLDDEDFTEEIDYIVECRESYPSHLYKAFFEL